MTDLVPDDADGSVDYASIRADVVALLETARRDAARSVNALMTASYWAIGQRIVASEQDGRRRASYGDALIERLADFLLELGDDFAFVGRQRRLRLDDSWFRVDLLFFHRRLRCLLSIDLKIGRFSHAGAGQMHMHLDCAREHWMTACESPVGILLCISKGSGDLSPIRRKCSAATPGARPKTTFNAPFGSMAVHTGVLGMRLQRRSCRWAKRSGRTAADWSWSDRH